MACLRLITDPTFNRVIVELPVRHGKSHYASFLLPAWFSMLFPEKSTILATHSASLSDEFGHRVRQCVATYGPSITGVELDPSFRSRNHYLTTQGGHFRTTSPGSSIAGKGCHLLLCDDLVKDAAAAASPTARHKLSQWFHSEAMTRLEPEGKVVLVMSRRHPSDLTGSLLQMNDELPVQDRWHTIRFPAIGDDGAALWPERYPIQKLLDIKRNFDLAGESHYWWSLYQQDPRGDASMLDWPDELFTDVLVGPDAWMRNAQQLFRVLAVDPSKGVSDHVGDFCAFMDTVFDTKGHLWVDPQLHRLMMPDIEDTIINLCRQTRFHGVLVETNGAGELLCANLIAKAKAQGVYLPLYAHTSTENKIVRIRAGLTRLLKDGKIHVDSRSQGARLLLQQLREFPSSQFDDGPDALDMAKRMIDKLLSGWRPTK